MASLPTRAPEYRRWLATALVAAGVVLNPWVLGMLFAPDGRVDGERRIAVILFVDLLCALTGVLWLSPALRTRVEQSWPRAIAGIAAAAAAAGLVVGIGWGIWGYRTSHHHTTDMATAVPPTAEQRAWADAFVRQSLDAARRHGWFDFDKATADGFVPQWSDKAHYVRREFVFDDHILDPERPEFLMFEDTPRGKRLVGYMFFTRTLEERGPQPAGSLAAWHFHPWNGRGYCAERGILPISRPDDAGRCATGVRVNRSAEMLHVWFVDHPNGPFADAMLLSNEEGGWDPTLFHPMLVHFAIALLFVAVLLDVGGAVFRAERLHSAGFINLSLAAVSAAAAVAAGMLAEVRLIIGHDVHQVLDTHKLLGFATLGGVLALMAWRITERGRLPRRGRALYLAGGLLVASLAGVAGHLGSNLVYVHGVAVQAIGRAALERLERAEYAGGRSLQPGPTDHVHHGAK